MITSERGIAHIHTMLRRSQSKRDSVRCLERGLALLELLNEGNGLNVTEAAKHLNMPRPTAHRLLATLEELGFVRRSAHSRFLVDIRARRLSGGYDTDVRLSEAVGPVLARLASELVWPVNIAICRGGMMVVRETTCGRSSVRIDRSMGGLQVPVLRSACGRAYLAFCPDEERREIVEYLTTVADPSDRPYLLEGAIHQMIAIVRRDGYAVRLNEPYLARTGTLAVPILIDGHAHGTIAVVWWAAALLPSQAIKQFVPALREAAAAIARKIVGAQAPLFQVVDKTKRSACIGP